MPDNDCSLVVVGASAGGVEALQRFVRALPGDFAAPVLVVLHASPTGRSYLPEILSRAGPLPAVHALDGAPLEPGRVYVAREERPDLLERFRVADTPTIVVVEEKRVRGRLAQPRGCEDIQTLLAPWLR